MEFGASYGSGGIGALVQPLIGERVFGTLKPNRPAGAMLRFLEDLRARCGEVQITPEKGWFAG
jgi:hypothetical protein